MGYLYAGGDLKNPKMVVLVDKQDILQVFISY